ncbi:hypothetical protein SOVF_077240 [Spinacia oleracea]|nr:hypothetical protein SOVF_077240 [Spinacia oleracea]
MQVLSDVKTFQVLLSEICLEQHHRDYRIAGCSELLTFRLCQSRPKVLEKSSGLVAGVALTGHSWHWEKSLH